jgi:hypothetical protein
LQILQNQPYSELLLSSNSRFESTVYCARVCAVCSVPALCVDCSALTLAVEGCNTSVYIELSVGSGYLYCLPKVRNVRNSPLANHNLHRHNVIKRIGRVDQVLGLHRRKVRPNNSSAYDGLLL